MNTFTKPSGWMLLALLGIASAGQAQDRGDGLAARRDLIDRQLDVSLEARDIERVLGQIKRASDLSKQRIGEAAEVTESASGAIGRGDSKSAAADAARAAVMFKEIANQLQALLAEETPQRVLSAQELAEQLSIAERQFLKQFPGSLKGSNGGQSPTDPRAEPQKPNPDAAADGSSKGEDLPAQKDASRGSPSPSDQPSPPRNPSPGQGPGKEAPEKSAQDAAAGGQSESEQIRTLAARADELAEQGKTLNDVLQAVLQSSDPADQEAIGRIDAILKETELEKGLGAIQQVPDMIRDGQLIDARLATMEAADRLEIAAQRLGAAYQAIVAPRAEEIRRLESALAALHERLNELETPEQVATWHREARQLLEEMDKLGLDDDLRNELLDEMARAGFAQGSAANISGWSITDGRYTSPKRYVTILVAIQEDIQERLQALLVGDIRSSPDDPAPPRYRDLVNRYYEVLSKEMTGGR